MWRGSESQLYRVKSAYKELYNGSTGKTQIYIIFFGN